MKFFFKKPEKSIFKKIREMYLYGKFEKILACGVPNLNFFSNFWVKVKKGYTFNDTKLSTYFRIRRQRHIVKKHRRKNPSRPS